MEVVDVDFKRLVPPFDVVELLLPLDVVVLVSPLEVVQILVMVILLVVIPGLCAC